MTIETKLELTFNEDAFGNPKAEENQTFNKPEFKKFNMKFHNIDLMLIDAIAKRDGSSRVQIINSLIEDILKGFIQSLPLYEGLLISRIVDESLIDKAKIDKSFSWELWLAENSGNFFSVKNKIEEFMYNERLSYETNGYPSSLKNLVQLLKNSKLKSEELQSTPTNAITE